MSRTAVKQAVLGGLPLLNPAQRRLFQVTMSRTAVEQAVLGGFPLLDLAAPPFTYT